MTKSNRSELWLHKSKNETNYEFLHLKKSVILRHRLCHHPWSFKARRSQNKWFPCYINTGFVFSTFKLTLDVIYRTKYEIKFSTTFGRRFGRRILSAVQPSDKKTLVIVYPPGGHIFVRLFWKTPDFFQKRHFLTPNRILMFENTFPTLLDVRDVFRIRFWYQKRIFERFYDFVVGRLFC